MSSNFLRINFENSLAISSPGGQPSYAWLSSWVTSSLSFVVYIPIPFKIFSASTSLVVRFVSGGGSECCFPRLSPFFILEGAVLVIWRQFDLILGDASDEFPDVVDREG